MVQVHQGLHKRSVNKYLRGVLFWHGLSLNITNNSGIFVRSKWVGAIWAPRNLPCPEARKENALTTSVAMSNLQYLINKDEVKWEAVIGIAGGWCHERDVG